MQREAIPPSLKKLATEFVSQKDKGREETNAANRLKTKLRNAVVAHWTAEQLPIGSYMRLAGMEFTYEAVKTETVDTDAILKLYDDGEISREQLLKIIKADKSATGTVLGGDVAADLLVTSIGNKVDVRYNDLPVEQADDEYIAVRPQIRKKINRSKFGRDASLREKAKAITNTQARPVKRRIKTRKS